MSNHKTCAKCGKPMGNDFGIIVVLTEKTSITMHKDCYETFKEETILLQSNTEVVITEVQK